jgi:hypothetical protein
MLDTFGGIGQAWLHGIRRDDTLACVAFSVDAHCESGRLVMLAFFARLFRTLNWQTSGQLIKVFSARPK